MASDKRHRVPWLVAGLTVVLAAAWPASEGRAQPGGAAAPPAARNEDRLRPYAANPRYWQYRGKPVLLLGGTKDDNLFQIPDLQEHLDLLQRVGGNVIRNTMSDRRDVGHEVYPFKQVADGRYDLDQWNEEYWDRFQTMLRLTRERDIIVQIEVWDRFDYARDNWAPHPYNPKNNVNYTAEQSGLAADYPDHPGSDKQPFFHTIPGMRRYQPRCDVVRKYQERFVEKLLSYSLPCGHVLYCMDNETSSPVAWGQYWMRLIRKKADEQGVSAYVTDMFDDAWNPESSASLRVAIDQPEQYLFLDVSQINSRNFGQDHWDRFAWVVQAVARSPRPLNHTKIYSAGQTSWGSGTPKDGIERFWRNVFGGMASARFHRPTSGIGLNEMAQACIRAARKIETRVKFWDVEPRMDLLADREPNEAYLAAKAGQAYVLFFTDGGSVGLDLRGQAGPFGGQWVDIATGQGRGDIRLEGNQTATVAPPGKGPWVVALVKAAPDGAAAP